MKTRLAILTAIAILFSGLIHERHLIAAQGTTQPYLAEMPPVDRVIREIQGTDPADTAAHQMGAFKQLKKIIEELAWNLDHRYMTRLTLAEKQISDAYEIAYARVWQAGPDKSADNMRGFDRDPQFREVILNKFFSPNLRARFKQSFADEDARRQAKAQTEAQAEIDVVNQQKAQVRLEHLGTRDPGTLQGRRCLESGRPAAKCLAEAMGGEIKEALDPLLGTENVKAGLRLNGIYPGKGFGIAFTHGLGQYTANVSCADLVPAAHPYSIELKSNQVVVRIMNGEGSFSLMLQPSGNLVGSGPVVINGNVIAGYARRWVEQRYSADNTVVPGSGHYESVPIYKPKTARCMLGTLTPTVNKNSSDLQDAGIFSVLSQLMTGTDLDLSTGLRLVGIFDGGPGVNLEFHPDSGTVGCREAAVAHNYTIGMQGNELIVNLQGPDGSNFSYLQDGTLRGPGSLTVNGRKAVGGTSPESPKGNYLPWSDTCTYNVLNPMRLGSRLDLNPLALAPPPTQSTGPANAILSISSGFPENGSEAALRGRTLMLLNDSFESILWDTGFPPSPVKGMPALATWGAVCETNQQLCIQGAKEGAKRRAASVVLDNMGQGSFAAVPAGTYYVFGQIVFNRHHYVWNYRIDLQAGQNSLKLAETNATLK